MPPLQAGEQSQHPCHRPDRQIEFLLVLVPESRQESLPVEIPEPGQDDGAQSGHGLAPGEGGPGQPGMTPQVGQPHREIPSLPRQPPGSQLSQNGEAAGARQP